MSLPKPSPKSTALITGASAGIGSEIARELARRGHGVVLVARRKDRLVALAEELSAEHGIRAEAIACDLGKAASRARIPGRITELGLEVEILVNNAGVGIFESVEQMSPEDFRAILETNLFGVFYCCHEAIPLMKQRGGGYIINISSLAGANPHPRMAAYNASKFGLNGFSEALMQEVRHDGIKVSYIMPGSVNTAFGGDEAGDSKSWQLQPEDIARVVLDLLHQDDRGLTSRVEIRPSRPPKK